MKKKIITICAAVLFLTALGLTLYPLISNYVNQKYASEIQTAYQELIQQTDDSVLQEAKQRAVSYNLAITPGTADAYSEESLSSAAENYDNQLDIAGNGIMGYVEIPSIQIRLPIYHGCTENEFSKGAGHLPSSSLPVGGRSTHAVLAAHSGRADSKMFTDLDQVKEGDLVYLYVLNKTLTYEVDKITVTTPFDTDAIQIIDGEDLLTLLTCTPYGTNTHRLLVRGHRIFPDETRSASNSSEEKPEHTDTAVHRSTWTNEYRNGLTEGLLFALLILLISVFLYGIIRLKTKRS